MLWVGARNSSITLPVVSFLLLVAVLALPFQGAAEGPVLLSSKIVAAKLKVKPLPAFSKHGMIPSIDRPEQTPHIHPSLLRIDLKQNLLVWPNIATHLTRSPPSRSL